MVFAAKLDEIGKPAWIALMILGFIIWWPVGLAILAFMLWSGRMGCRSEWRQWKREQKSRYKQSRYFGPHGQSSGYSAFEDYRAETLRRLEDEQQEFMDYLERLRQAKDKAEFDEFMSERRNRPQTSPSSSAPDTTLPVPQN